MADDATIVDRVQELTWSLVDDQITDDEVQLLEGLLLADDKARDTYIHCIQLHADLIGQFAKPESPLAPGKSPVLAFLGGSVPPMDTQSSKH